MKSFRNFILQFVLYIMLGLLCFGLYKLFVEYYKSPMPSLSQGDIPQETIDWFSDLWDNGSDIGGILDTTDRNPDDWTRYEDIDSMLFIEDEYFVIYYSAKDSVVEHNKALVCQGYAHEAIPKAELFMKRYPYPDSINGRKLPIYLAKTVDDSRSICNQLGHGYPDFDFWGLYCFSFSVNNVFTDGIIISPETWSVTDLSITPKTQDEQFKRTLWHEMNHFMYFTYWDYSKVTKPRLWFTEGLAEYFAQNYNRLNEVDDYKGLNLADDFIEPGNIEYWGGLSAYLCLEKSFGISTVSNVVYNSCDRAIEEAVTTVLPNYSLAAWNDQWHTFMENKEYKKYMH